MLTETVYGVVLEELLRTPESYKPMGRDLVSETPVENKHEVPVENKLEVPKPEQPLPTLSTYFYILSYVDPSRPQHPVPGMLLACWAAYARSFSGIGRFPISWPLP